MAIVWVECWKCDSCGHRWIKGELYPSQCAKCRSRKWDKSGAVAQMEEQRPYKPQRKDLSSSGATKSSMDDLRAACAGKLPKPEMEKLPEPPMCPYTEYDGQTGETYGCCLLAHGPKTKHQRGRRV